jgi:hypothetical protein
MSQAKNLLLHCGQVLHLLPAKSLPAKDSHSCSSFQSNPFVQSRCTHCHHLHAAHCPERRAFQSLHIVFSILSYLFVKDYFFSFSVP